MFDNKPLVCTVCGYIGKPKRAVKGNGFIEIILWFFFIIPGVIYSIWRSSSRHNICPKCKNTSLIPADTPMGEKMIKADSTNQVETFQEKSKQETKWTTIVIGIVIAMVTISALVAISDMEDSPALITETPVVTSAYNIPSLFGKNIDELKNELGEPRVDTEPTKQQLSMGMTEWEKSYTKDGQDLLITYNVKNRKVKDFFLSGSDKNHLLKIGKLSENDSTYTLEFVKAIKNPSQITGVIVTPKQ